MLETVNTKIRDGQPLDEIKEELIESGNKEDLIDKAIKRLTEDSVSIEDKKPTIEEPSQTKWLLFTVFFTIFLILPFILDTDMLILIYFTSAILLIKGLIYSLILFSIIKLGDPTNIQPFSKYYFGAVFITFFSLMPWPIVRLLLVIFATVYVIVMVMNTTISKAFFFIVIFIIAEAFIGFGVLHLEGQFLDSDYQPNELGLSSKIYCFTQQHSDIYEMNYISTLRAKDYDFCTTKHRVIEKYKTDSCSGAECYMVEYSCNIFERKANLFNCPQGCSDGACLRND